MSPRQPSVQNVMTTVGRRMQIRRVLPQKTATLQKKERFSSLFVSPILEDIYVRMASAFAASALETASSNSSDLATKLCSFYQRKDITTAVTVLLASGGSRAAMMQTKPKETTELETLHNSIKDAVLSYNPTLNSAILRRVARAVDLKTALGLAKDFVRAIRDGGDFGRVCSGLMRQQPVTTDMHERELQAGIAARLHQGGDGRRIHRLSGFRLCTSDVQVAEVLPSGKIVTLVSPTLPGAAEVKFCESALEKEKYLHFVLYKEGISLSKAFNLLSEVCEGDCSPESFSVNVALEESAVTVQVCSLCVPCPNTGSSCYKVYRERLLKKLLRVNLRPLQLSLQVLGWRQFPCDPSNSQRCQMQYSVLIRGINTSITSKGIHLENRALAKLAAFPNFFGPRHFGIHPSFCCPFRFYHAAAALEQNMPAEALVIAACLSHHDAESTVADGWINEMVELFRQGEDRDAVLREWYWLHVPSALKAQIAASKAALLWNVLASCRLCEMGESAIDGVPEPGDFVMRNDVSINFGGTVAKPELFPDSCLENVICGDGNLHCVRAIFSREDALPYSLRDVAIPLNVQDNFAINQLSHLLGFLPRPLYSLKRFCGTTNPVYSQVNFRPLFATGSGYPRAARPFVKALPEICSVMEMNEEKVVYKLLTDMELRQRADYTAGSRGQSTGVWPIGKYGHRLVDRLPAGAIGLATSNTAQQRGTKCLALHFTLPLQSYSMSFFREFILVEDHTTLAQRTHVGSKLLSGVARTVEVKREPKVYWSFDGPDDGNIMQRHGD